MNLDSGVAREYGEGMESVIVSKLRTSLDISLVGK